MSDKGDALDDLFVIVNEAYARWDEGESVGWDAIKQACDKMIDAIVYANEAEISASRKTRKEKEYVKFMDINSSEKLRNVARGNKQISIANNLQKFTGVKEKVYFDGVDLVVGSKTVLPNALSGNATLQDAYNAIVENEEQAYRDRERNNENVYDWRSKEESMINAVQGYAEKPFLDLTIKERLALMNLTTDPTAYKDDKITSIKMDSIWEFNSETNEGPDKDEAEMFSLEMWDNYNLVIVYYPKRFDNLEFNGLASNIYQALMDQEWYGGFNATYEEIKYGHPELLGSWSKPPRY